PVDSIPLTGTPVTLVPSQETSKEAAVAVGQADNPAQSAPPTPTSETAPVTPPPSEAQRRASIFRNAAAGEWDSLDQAKDLVQQMLTKALITTETPGGAKALPFVEQVVAVAQANQAKHVGLAQQATIEVAEKFLQDKPHFIDREELTEQFRKVGLAASWPEEGVRLLAAEPGSERSFVARYRLDSNSIDQIDFIFKKINGAAGSHVVESGAATKQRADKALDCFIDKQHAGNTNQRERPIMLAGSIPILASLMSRRRVILPKLGGSGGGVCLFLGGFRCGLLGGGELAPDYQPAFVVAIGERRPHPLAFPVHGGFAIGQVFG
nr:hypothetical protein [Tanacetum cinerariifolium]